MRRGLHQSSITREPTSSWPLDQKGGPGVNFFDSQRLLLHLLRLATRHDLNLSYISDTRTHTHTRRRSGP